VTEIPASLVKQLRDETGAGMMDCKRALQETGGDVEAAKTLLRKQGLLQASKRAGRETTEGRVLANVSNGTGVMVAVGSETEPVSKSQDFLAFAERALGAVEEKGESAVEELEGERIDLVSRLGENIVVRGAKVEAGDGEQLATYIHPPAQKIGVLVRLRGGSPELARLVAMHISFAAPGWLRRDEVPSEVVDTERQIYLNSDELQGKPEQARDKIVEGMLNKRFFAAQPGGVLLDQPWIHDTGKTVGQALADEGAELVEFRRFSVAG
jgi:elongation factor Ts